MKQLPSNPTELVTCSQTVKSKSLFVEELAEKAAELEKQLKDPWKFHEVDGPVTAEKLQAIGIRLPPKFIEIDTADWTESFMTLLEDLWIIGCANRIQELLPEYEYNACMEIAESIFDETDRDEDPIRAAEEELSYWTL